jgi:hypothetical protein
MKVLRVPGSAAVALLLLAGCATDKMTHPQPVAVPAGLTQVQVGEAVKAALVGHGWVLTDSTDTSYTASLTGNGWEATIRTPYDTREIKIEYVSSKGLDHHLQKSSSQTGSCVYNLTCNGTLSNESGGEVEVINRHWNNWMTALTHDIRANLAKAARGK